MTDSEIFDAAFKRLTKAITDLMQQDGHPWSSRPCSTCRSVSAIVGYDFGCVVVRKAREKLVADSARSSTERSRT